MNLSSRDLLLSDCLSSEACELRPGLEKIVVVNSQFLDWNRLESDPTYPH